MVRTQWDVAERCNIYQYQLMATIQDSTDVNLSAVRPLHAHLTSQSESSAPSQHARQDLELFLSCISLDIEQY